VTVAENILVLGGGVGGLVVANRLRKRLPREHHVVLVERERTFVFAPSLLWLMIGGRTASQISRPMERLGKKGIEVVTGEIERIDPEKREAVVGGKTLTGDYLVICLGAELAPELVPGLAEAGHGFYTLPGAESLWSALSGFGGGRIALLTAAMPYKCPAAPYEAAMLIESYCRTRNIKQKTQIDLFTAEPGPMGVTGPEISKAVRAMVEGKGITYHPEHAVKEVDGAKRRLRFANGVEADYDLLAYVPHHRAPKAVRDSGLAESGWITVDRATLETKFPRVYALGDVVNIPLAMGKPLPKAGVFAHGQGEVVARNIARAITGKGRGEPSVFDGHGACFLETGDGRAGIGSGNFYAEPTPEVKLKAPGWYLHWAKVLFEKDFLYRWF
jgi:sulfide:quinone oxidoreductase